MSEKTKIFIGVSLPLIVILFAIGSAIIPSFFFKPKYDFIYTMDPYCTNYSYNCSSWSGYKVVDGKIQKDTTIPLPVQPVPPPMVYDKSNPQVSYPKLYRYTVISNSFGVISLEDAQKLALTDGGSAPDGTTISNDYSTGGFIGEILGGGSRYGLYMKNRTSTRQVVVQNGDQGNYYYSQNFHLIGWVK